MRMNGEAIKREGKKGDAAASGYTQAHRQVMSTKGEKKEYQKWRRKESPNNNNNQQSQRKTRGKTYTH